jgi:hypothetical protein
MAPSGPVLGRGGIQRLPRPFYRGNSAEAEPLALITAPLLPVRHGCIPRLLSRGALLNVGRLGCSPGSVGAARWGRNENWRILTLRISGSTYRLILATLSHGRQVIGWMLQPPPVKALRTDGCGQGHLSVLTVHHRLSLPPRGLDLAAAFLWRSGRGAC